MAGRNRFFLGPFGFFDPEALEKAYHQERLVRAQGSQPSPPSPSDSIGAGAGVQIDRQVGKKTQETLVNNQQSERDKLIEKIKRSGGFGGLSIR